MELNLDSHFANIFGALAPAIAYVLVFFARKGIEGLSPKGKALVKAVLPTVGPVLGVLLNWVTVQQGGADSIFLAAAWGGVATVIYEFQKGIVKAKQETGKKK